MDFSIQVQIVEMCMQPNCIFVECYRWLYFLYKMGPMAPQENILNSLRLLQGLTPLKGQIPEPEQKSWLLLAVTFFNCMPALQVSSQAAMRYSWKKIHLHEKEIVDLIGKIPYNSWASYSWKNPDSAITCLKNRFTI